MTKSYEKLKVNDKIIVLFSTEDFNGKAVKPETVGVITAIDEDSRWGDAEWCEIKSQDEVIKVRLEDCWKKENAIQWTGENPVGIGDFLGKSICVSVNTQGDMSIDLSDFDFMGDEALEIGGILLKTGNTVFNTDLRGYSNIVNRLMEVETDGN